MAHTILYKREQDMARQFEEELPIIVNADKYSVGCTNSEVLGRRCWYVAYYGTFSLSYQQSIDQNMDESSFVNIVLYIDETITEKL